MTAVRVRVPAKVNLALRVGGTDEQGYHRLGTVFQAVSLGDEVVADDAPAGEFRLVFNGEGAGFLPVDDTNLAIKAAKLLATRFGRTDVGVSLLIRKRIPVAGGMAGGSADAAAVLVACTALWGIDADREELHRLAAELGADVPFLLMGGTAIGTGRGDVLTPIMSSGTFHWTLALSHTGLSTPAVFREFDRLSEPQDTEIPVALLEALRAGDAAAVGASLVNDLERAAISLQPTLARTLELGLAAGALGAIVSGSGPTCAFLAGSDAHSHELAEALAVFSGVRAVRRAFGPVPGAQVLS
ncbi:4-(cytidine 5'-diphospho)-2-C-methyl-D-erythritol kinase [Tessaracoccus lapidicaptus]|uniref:4-diphosphocytidyl-2-C-methyl-D-erythritol kinase n=1 Tax=Tessaracoccus lapidicaptus TaxID=1427523 RepID=A0A1C0APW8_9ACTN|nr:MULTISPECIES: 4-(cytidine 5'-diphospho)-2-C-methyl-D-erythritol kinase [Tessaracoccus]AQX15340.1 4-(cytidine 5'-diphospho)-2-C-methyl-D-erythritol kinase [Tessaracoccus sp. T2.5-30]OCL36337.1 4-(cytidine 5'-diphospho)-2-C-methyl-D-erythritol kinase [Tessaracoccus lapidicaptus]VEP39625.1 4-diphosphocytidyl-2-C-methyl-D-erythritol kinase [Tessaracoccus lapidicaptus]